MAFETYPAMPGKPCSGNNTCCNRPEFDRAMFPCDRATQLTAEADRLASRVAELEALVRAQAERIAAQSELLSKVAELRAVLAPIVEFVRRVFLRGGSADEMPVSLGVNPVIGQCCTFGDLRRLAALALVPTTEVADG